MPQDERAIRQEESVVKAAYHSPQLTVYGDLRLITQASMGPGAVDGAKLDMSN